jgi:hypothetical protein
LFAAEKCMGRRVTSLEENVTIGGCKGVDVRLYGGPYLIYLAVG